jgi:glycerophosphoryl diester phosphodiesterase
MGEFICIGHRGASGYEPENTFSSFEKAINMGCPWIELDVYSVESELLVIHDNSLKRTTNGTGKVTESTLTYLRGLDAGKNQQIPTLAEVVALVDKRCAINIELKGPATAEPVSAYLGTLCTNDCANSWQENHFVLSSFNHRELAKADIRFRRGALFGKPVPNYFQRTDKLKAYSINLSIKLVEQGLVDAAHDHGLKVFVYTVNKTDDIKRMVDMDVDGVFCDYPDRVFTVLENP